MGYYEDGVKQQQQGNHSGAIECFKKAINENSTNSWPYHNKGESHMALRQAREAHEAFDNAIKINPTYVWSYYQKGKVYLELEQKYPSAQKYFSRALMLDSNSEINAECRAIVEKTNAEYDNKSKQFEFVKNAIRDHPDQADAGGVILDGLLKMLEIEQTSEQVVRELLLVKAAGVCADESQNRETLYDDSKYKSDHLGQDTAVEDIAGKFSEVSLGGVGSDVNHFGCHYNA